MRDEKTLDPTIPTLTEFSALAWRELAAYSPDGRRARLLAGLGAFMLGISAISLVLYGIYHALGTALAGHSGPVPGIVWVTPAVGAAGVVLLAVAGLMRRRSMRALTTATSQSRADGHAVPGSHTS
jgi:hypothetical protein